MLDLERLADDVKAKVPRVGVYLLPHGSNRGTVDFRMPPIKDKYEKYREFRFTVTVDRNGDILGAWPCRTSAHRKLMRTVLDAVEAQEAGEVGVSSG